MTKSGVAKNILLFWPNNDWGNYGRTYEKVAEQLSRHEGVRRVVCIFPPIRWKKFARLRPLTIRRISSSLWLVNENQSGCRQSLRDTNSGNYKEKWSGLVLGAFLRVNGFTRGNTILWLFPPHPYMDVLLEKVPHRFVLTQIVDNFSKIDPSFWLYEFAKEQYPRVSEFSDMVVTSSQANYEEFSKENKHCYMFDNAVDESFIAKPSSSPYKLTGERPRLGYVGWITERTDLSLLEYVARECPEWSLHIAGPQHGHKIEESNLARLSNVEYLGPIPYREVAGFLQTLDVCLIPHKDTEYSKSMSPLKLYQYLASGRPIVSSNIAGLEKYREYVSVSENFEEFVECIKDALESDSLRLSAARVKKAKMETWDKRVRDIYNKVSKHMSTKT